MRQKQAKAAPKKKALRGLVEMSLYTQVAADAQANERSIIGQVVWILKQHYGNAA